MITYPATLPCPKIDSHTNTLGKNFIRSSFNYSQEQVFISKDTNKFTYTVVIDHLQKLDFEEFYEALYDGTMPFLVDWTIANETITKAKFVGGYSFKPLGNLLQEVSANMEVIQ